MAATDGTLILRHRGRKPFKSLPWIMAGVGILGGRMLRAQSSVELRTLLYNESDGRTRVVSPSLLLHQEFSEALGKLDLILSHDAVSGASPTGGYPTLSVSTTTSASGIRSTTASGKIPTVLFSDERKAESISYSRRIGAPLPTLDLSHSVEKDYTAREVGLSDAWTLMEGRGTLHYGLSWADDTVSPVNQTLNYSKKARGYALGWTWVLGGDDLVDVSLSRMRQEGFLSEPYLIVPVGAAALGDTRPGVRTRDALVLKQGHYFDWDGALKTSYRYYRDDWGLRAHTLEFTYEQHLVDSWVLSPRLRLYTQNDASFYGPMFAAARPYMSADYRLSALQSALVGCTVSAELFDGVSFNLGATYQIQQGKHAITPLASGAGSSAVYSGPSVSAADINTATFTLGLKWQY